MIDDRVLNFQVFNVKIESCIKRKTLLFVKMSNFSKILMKMLILPK